MEVKLVNFSHLFRIGTWDKLISMLIPFYDFPARCKPDTETYNALISAHGRAGQWRWAMNIFDDMLRAAV